MLPQPERPRPRRSVRRTGPALLAPALLGMALLLVPGIAHADGWRDLTGRRPPDLVFEETAGGIEPGTTLASYRGEQVVLLVFWLRDCPHCKRELPRVQRLHEVWQRSGLQVVSIVHDKYPLAQVTPVMAQRGWTFPVVRDRGGRMADRFGGGRRPGFYVIGIDGRVKSSISLSERVVHTQLSTWRVHELEREGAMPEALARARAHVASGNYGAALRAAEAQGNQADASPEVRAAVARLKSIAEQKLQNRVDRAQAWLRSGTPRDVERARSEYDGIVETFRGTSLESKATALRDQFVAARRGG